MATLATELRNKLERTSVAARNLGEKAAKAALEALAVHHHEAYGHMGKEQKDLRNKLRARARQLGDVQDARGQLAIKHLAQECAYEHWHRMLFARFLAENHLLIEPEMGVAVSLEECKELAKEAKTNLWALAGRYAQVMLPEIFRADDPVLHVSLAREDQIELEELLDDLPAAVFTASDSLGWCYQFWQTERKDQVNASGDKIGADELPSVTQLFTEDYMVDFLLDNTLGAWWAGKVLAANPALANSAKSEEELRKAVALPGAPWKYLRFIKGRDGRWTPAAGTFEGWPKTAKELRCLDPCCGSGHFIVAMFERLVALRMAEEKADEKAAVTAVIRDNLFGLELDARCTQIGAFSVALAAWRRVGHCALPAMHIACSGLAPNTREGDWLKLAGDSDKLQRGMARLYRLFQNAPVLGSLVNPRASGGDLLEAGFQELRPLLGKALAQEAEDDTAHEMAVTAQGIAKAAEILAGRFTLVATNVPYLGRGKQHEVLQDYCERVHPEAKSDLATCFVERCMEFCARSGHSALVTPQNWWFSSTYKKLRQQVLAARSLHFAATLGEEAWQAFGDRGPFAGLICFGADRPEPAQHFAGIDALPKKAIPDKIAELEQGEVLLLSQAEMSNNSDHRIAVAVPSRTATLEAFAKSYQGIKTGDDERVCRCFWEFSEVPKGWRFYQSSVSDTCLTGGMELVLFWEDGGEGLARRQGISAWEKSGVLVCLMRDLPATRYFGHVFSSSVSPLVISDKSHLLPIWAFCSSAEFQVEVRKIDRRVCVTNANILKVPFDLSHWQKVAAEKYPHGFPKPFSSDATQWLFNGHPKGADQPLQVAVARLL
ncbi:MAG: SAM-dependent DNA methyltransferase, partial [Verrucomicrobiota bacterium]|nr:SAM-dependent DNA methyltransferase [Verrucomicrobiota bacterium]